MKPNLSLRKSLPLPPRFDRKATIKNALAIIRSPLKKSGKEHKRTESQNFEPFQVRKHYRLSKLNVGILIQDFQMIYNELKIRLKNVRIMIITNENVGFKEKIS